MTATRMFLTFMLLLAGGSVPADEPGKRAGNLDARTLVDARIRPIYDTAGPWTHTFDTRNEARLPGAAGSEVNGALIEGRFARLYVGAWTRKGKYAAEYYLEQGRVALVYETFEYFESAAPRAEWRNFKGLAAWERRTYVDQGAVVYTESNGRTAPPLLSDAAGLQRLADVYVARLETARVARSAPP